VADRPRPRAGPDASTCNEGERIMTLHKYPRLVLGILAVCALAPVAARAAAEIGATAPDFTLTDTEGGRHTLSELTEAGQIVVLEWFNPDCPFIRKHHEVHRTMNELRAEFADRGVVWLAVNSGAAGQQGHGLERNRRARADYAIEYPVLLDETGEVGRLYGAKTTPHMFVVGAGKERPLLYAGAIDDNRSARELGKTNHVREALAAILAGEEVATPRTDPYGCSVKYGAR
jgi:peroxiredoxin